MRLAPVFPIFGIVEIVHGKVLLGLVVLIVGLPVLAGVAYVLGMIVAVPLLWGGTKLNPDTRFAPDELR